MSKQFHRQIGKLGNRSADNASVSMLIKEVEDTDTLLEKLLEHSKAWRDSWALIFNSESRLVDSFHNFYEYIPRKVDAYVPAAETPEDVMNRVEKLQVTYRELKEDMLHELVKVDRLLIQPLNECRTVLKPVKKAIEKRENKKLDYERFLKATEHSRAKQNKTERDYNVLTRNERDLEKATVAYETSDDYIRDKVPRTISAIVDFLPLVVEISVQIQFTLLQNSYSSFYHYGNEHGFSDSDNDVIVSEWEDQFLALQDDIESNVSIIAGGKAVKMPMTLVQDNSIIAKVPGMMSLGRHTRAPSVTSQTLATDSARTHRDSAETSRPEIGKQRSSTSISTKYSRSETSPPTTSSSQRRSIGNARMRTPSIASGIDREESPPPPLPQPISSNSRRRNESNHLSGEQGRGGRQGSGIGSGTIPTPLAGLTPSNLASRTGTNIQSGQASVQMPLRISSSSLVRLSSSTQKSYSKTLDQGDLSTIVKTKKKPPPPPPKKKFGAPKEVWVRAIYPFQGQSEGDLSFDEGDRIKVLKKTDSTVDWWDGEVNGCKGQFPANYCEPMT